MQTTTAFGCERLAGIVDDQYAPEPLHFMRFRYDHEIVTEDLLPINRADESLDETTSIDDAKEWVQDEFQVRLEE